MGLTLLSTDLTARKSAIDEFVVGWMEAVFCRTDPFTGKILNGLGPEDFRRVQSGYGCPNCLAIFKTYLLRCPVCDFTRDVFADVEQTPEFWEDHLKQRHEHDTPQTRPLSADEFIAEIMADKNIDRRRI